MKKRPSVDIEDSCGDAKALEALRVPEAKLEGSASPSRRFRKDSPFIPSSPTDRMLSPITRKLLKKPVRERRMQTRHYKFPSDESKDSINTVTSPSGVSLADIDIILGSSSSARAAILTELGWNFTTMSPNIDEKAIRCKDPSLLVQLLAKAKATAIIDKLQQVERPTVVITSDTVVLFNEVIREKPESAEQCAEFIRSYSNSKLSTVTAVVVTHLPSLRQHSEVDIATVYWSSISEEAAEELSQDPELLYCCGGFKVEAPEFRRFVRRIDGAEDSVRGLPIDVLYTAISEVMHAEESKHRK